VYELLVRDFVATHDYQTLIDTLDYLQKLGVNAIELMPIMEFEGNSSWGYGVSHFFAPDKYYGTKDKLKEFIDECHGRGFAVILDVVTNHVFGESPLARMFWDAANGKPAASSPYLNPDARHPYTVGYDFNHESLATQEHFDRLFAHWVTEYKIDGYRLDLAKGITQKFSGNDVGLWGQYDASRIALVKGYGDRLWSVDPDVYMILEYFAENSEEKELAEYGFLIWGNLVFEYNEATMGWISGSNFQDVSAKQRNWNVQNLVGYMESHDEERQMYKNLTFGNSSGIYNVKTLPVATDRSGMAAAFLFTVPGPKMLYMFGELGYDISIDDPCRTCEKPILWNYLDDPDRRKLFNVYAALIKLKEEEPAFSTSNYSMDVGGTIKRIHLNHASMNVTVVGNFSVTPVNGPANFQHGGWWYDYFSGDSINVSNTSASLSFDAGEYHIYTDVRLSSPDIALGTINPLILGEGISAFPNPSNNSVTFAFDLLSAVPVRMELYDMNGRIIRRFMDEQTLPPGKQTYTWDGKNAAGQRVNPGYYFVRIQAGTDLKTLKLVYLD
jgi:glycosidase